MDQLFLQAAREKDEEKTAIANCEFVKDYLNRYNI